MGMLGGIIGGALGIGASIYGGAKASKAMKNVKNNLNQQMKENQDWYDKNYYEDPTQRADAQRVLALTAENIRDRNREAAGTQAVTGGTEESVATTKAANAESLSEAASQIAVNGENRKDMVESRYMDTKSGLNDKLNNLEEAKANNLAQAAQGVAQAGSSIAGMF